MTDRRADEAHRITGSRTPLKILVSLVSFGFTFLTTYIFEALSTRPEVLVGLIASLFVAGVAFVVQFLYDLERRQAHMEANLERFAGDAQRLAGQRDAEAEQMRLLIRYVEEQLPIVIKNTFQLGQREEPLVRELAHSLNTPLAQMEATVLGMGGSTPSPGSPEAAILAGLRASKAFLATFRQVATLARDSQAWEADSISKTVQAAGELYVAKAANGARLDVILPDDLDGYGRNYVVAALLPLLENAVESSPSDRTVEVTAVLTARFYLLQVTNHVDGLPHLPDDMYVSGWSSKHDHEGLGLATVQTILASLDGASLTHTVDGSRVTFTIQLPRRRS
ncbi:ATP-binding protein [Catellatospora chokoriensis]|uniref:ATP-binding protein n=1 Tax=Catellatospora chokoriensis TaxID=310353 RepID=UPI00177E161F|nr:GHKL domain-containing protein [Catellatospora chokoriensis]